MFDLGAQELIVIFIVAFLVFGPKRLPELGRTLGKGIRELKAAMRNMKDTLEESDLNVSKEIKDATSGIENSVRKAVETEDDAKAGTEVKGEEKPVSSNLPSGTMEEGKEKPESDKNG